MSESEKQTDGKDGVDMRVPDLSRFLHPGVWDYVVPPLMPGSFFIISLVLANSGIAATFLKAERFAQYLALLGALFFAFVIGLVFVMWVATLHELFRLISWAWRPLRRQAIERLLRPKIAGKQRWLAKFRFVWRIHAESFLSMRLRATMNVWSQAAIKLLKTKYDIEPGRHWDQEGEIWSHVLGTAKPVKGAFFIMVVHATGWSGIAAVWLAPEIRQSHLYLLLVVWLFSLGFLGDFRAVKRMSSPEFNWTFATKAVLRDFPDLTKIVERTPGVSDEL